MRCCEEEKKDAAKGSLTPGWVVPLLDGVDVAAYASGADGDSRNTKGSSRSGRTRPPPATTRRWR